jgi:hypothetical protein
MPHISNRGRGAMTDSVFFLHAAEEPEAAPDDGDDLDQSRVFAQVISTPPGLPWDQMRVARLEAGLSAPLPISDLAFQLHRLEAWAFGAPGRFAACYARRSEAMSGLAETLEIEGRTIKVRFEAPALAARRRRLQLAVGLGAAVIVAISASAIVAALTARDENEAQLSALEAQVQARLRQADQRLSLAAEAGALDTADVSGQNLDHVLSDLAWVAEAKVPEAKLNAWVWQKGAMAVEARGDQSPFQNADRVVKRAPKPLRRGVYLYGIEPVTSQTAPGGG